MEIDYLAIGHVTKDLIPNGWQVGGPVSFSGLTARALGCRTAVYSSAVPFYNWSTHLPGVEIGYVPAVATTTFENVYTPNGRQQTLHAVAERLTAKHLPKAWQRAGIVHFAPVANEVDEGLLALFSNSLVCVTPQGWMRRWDENGRVYAVEWEAAEALLPLAAATVVSEEDLPDTAVLEAYQKWSRLLVLTQGENGCTVFMDGESRHFAAPPVSGSIETTGAGDIFSAAFFIRLQQTDGNPWEAARFANQVAAQSITQPTIEGKIEQITRWRQASS